MKKIWEFQTVFSYLINERQEEEIYIIVEDIDRS
jgi:hypothetical protein